MGVFPSKVRHRFGFMDNVLIYKEFGYIFLHSDISGSNIGAKSQPALEILQRRFVGRLRLGDVQQCWLTVIQCGNGLVKNGTFFTHQICQRFALPMV